MKKILRIIMLVGLVAGLNGEAQALPGSVIDTFVDESMIDSRTNLVVTSGQVQCDAGGRQYDSFANTNTDNGDGSWTFILQPSGGNNDGSDDGSKDKGKDAMIFYYNPTTNYGNNSKLRATNSSCNAVIADSFIQFNLTNLPSDADLVTFHGYLHVHDYLAGSGVFNGVYTVNLQNVTSSWDEMTITANNAPGVGSYSYSDPTEIHCPDGSGAIDEWRSWTITDWYNDVQDGITANYGLRLTRHTPPICYNGNDWYYLSSDGAPESLRPKLEVVYTPPDYLSSGALVSTNLLSFATDSIDSFSYNAVIPSGTSLQIQFSQDNSTWYNSAGLSGWDSLSEGNNTISLSSLSWSGANFYYKVEFGSDEEQSATPLLNEIILNYNGSVIPEPASLLLLGFGVVGIAVFRRIKIS